MSARYWVLVSDELMAQVGAPQWPEGLRVIEAGPYDETGARWCKVEDDGAPATLEGKRVELTFTRSGDTVMIGGRRPAI
ncbi:MAG: hypothetical protein ACRDOL_22645 [Streptosporangiaceae bacterium]